VGAAELTERLAPQAIDDIPVGHYVPLLEFNLKNSGKLEVAQQIANHESPRTTKLYDRRSDEISLDEIERIAI
jgi:hypothetical protein